MNSNDHPSAYGYQPSHFNGNYPQRPPPDRPHVPEVMLKELFVQVERKLFVLALHRHHPQHRPARIASGAGGNDRRQCQPPAAARVIVSLPTKRNPYRITAR
jgi:hypothetical protein